MGPTVDVPQPDELAATLVRIVERLDALEAAAAKADTTTRDELAKVAWAVQHGRKRPW